MSNRLFNRTVGEGVSSGSAWTPAVDIFDTDQAIVLRAELPGLTPEDIDIEIDDNVLSLKGERRFEKKTDEENYHRVERAYGEFSRSFTLPHTVTVEDAKAEFDNGMLTVTLKKREETKARKIEVTGTGRAPKTIDATKSAGA